MVERDTSERWDSMSTPASDGSVTPTGSMTKEKLKLHVFAGDPILRTLDAKSIHPDVLYVLPVTIILIGGLLAARYGYFTQPGLGDSVCHDIATVFPGKPRWSCLSNYRSDVKYSYLRDIPTVFCLFVIGLVPRLLYKQWRAMQDLLPQMWADGLLLFAGEQNEQHVADEVKSANDCFARVGRSGSVLALVAALLVLPVVTAEQRGVFPYFTEQQSGVGIQSSDFYANWWATFHHPVAWTFYFAALTLGAYFVILMNIIGARVVLLLRKIRGHLVAEASAENVDGSYGWANAREVLAASYIATALYAMTLAAMSFVLPASLLWVLSLFFLQWIVVLPFYLWIPLSQIKKSIDSYKAREIRQMRERSAEIRSSRRPDDIREQQDISSRLEMIRSIRALPFRAFRDLATGLFTLLASAASIYAAITIWYSLS